VGCDAGGDNGAHSPVGIVTRAAAAEGEALQRV